MIGLAANAERVRAAQIADHAIAGQLARGAAAPELRARMRHIASGDDFEEALSDEVMRDGIAVDRARAHAIKERY